MTSLLERLAETLNRSPVPYVSRNVGFFGGGFDASNRESQLGAMTSTGTIFAIVDRLAESVSEVQWNLYRRTRSGNPEDRRVVTRHAALNLIRRPNPFMRGRELFEISQQHYELTGEAWWVIDAPFGIPAELWPVRPDRMRPVKHPTEFIVGYIYRGPNGEEVPLTRDQVVLTKRPHPLDIYRGAGAVQSILADIDSARFGAEWNRNFFLNGAEPGGLIEVDHEMDDDEFDRLVRRWREQHQGVGNAHRVAVLEVGKWVDRKFSMRDMQFAELRNVSRETIREAFGFPKMMLGATDDINRANALAGERMYARWLVQPRAERWKDTLNNEILPLFGAEGLEFDYVSPLPEDREDRDRERDSKVNAWATLVEAGADPDDAADVVGLPRMRTVRQTASGGQGAGDGGQEDGDTAQARAISEIIQKIYLGVTNNVVTREEAREIINRAGAGLPTDDGGGSQAAAPASPTGGDGGPAPANRRRQRDDDDDLAAAAQAAIQAMFTAGI